MVERTAQVQVIMDRMAETDEPAVLMGDLNARPNAPELAPLYAASRTRGGGRARLYDQFHEPVRSDFVSSHATSA
ncbi:MAG: hypothetical protein WKH64_04985 [Chloroflexia bacterium]